MHSSPVSFILVTELETERLWLRPYKPEMAAVFCQLLQENLDRLKADFPDRTSAVKTVEDAQERINVLTTQRRRGDLYGFGLWRKDNGDYIGDISLRRLARGKLFAEVGYYLHASQEGQGFATEALKEILRFGFQELRMTSINVRCAQENTKSQRVAERSGFSQRKMLAPTAHETSNGEKRHVYCYTLYRNEYLVESLDR
ncbi:GNAT family N-acetyltransferase [Rufibacter sp. LB8]|uniref:GNAT family N-acetyltransferase n=1 Tax=Rufibacter sp. LB8 TaxID=2777781 RepID=UPI00178C525D|nr:GNAT family N-acetyltransferase [Rufibacter sp. LB8]